MSSLRTSVEQRRTDAPCSRPGDSSAIAPRENSLPTTAARSSTASLERLELVEARGEQRLDRRRDACSAVVALREHRDHLLDEERVALGRLGDARARRASSGQSGRELGEQLRGLVVGQRLERERRAAAQRGRSLEQLGPREAEEQDRRVAAPAGDVLERSRNVGSAQWTSSRHDDERTLARERLEQPADRPEESPPRSAARAAPTRREPLDDQRAVGLAATAVAIASSPPRGGRARRAART